MVGNVLYVFACLLEIGHDPCEHAGSFNAGCPGLYQRIQQYPFRGPPLGRVEVGPIFDWSDQFFDYFRERALAAHAHIHPLLGCVEFGKESGAHRSKFLMCERIIRPDLVRYIIAP